MPSGFFSPSQVQTTQAPRLVPRCGQCKLYRGCKSPKMKPTGEGRKGILVIAEAPGEEEDKKGIQLIGRSGKLLRKILRKYKIDLDRDCWKTNACICRPEGTQSDKQILACRPNVLKAIEEYQPKVIILLGARAVKSLIGYVWKENVGAIGRWIGWQIPSQQLNTWICPTYHPAYLLRQNQEVLELHFSQHLKAAIELNGRPWEEVPDYGKQIQVVIDTTEAARLIRDIGERGGEFAFDFETTGLKPEPEWAEIVSCAICWEGKYTISYPWSGKAVEATGRLLKGDQGKIAHNAKFEARWVKAKLGHNVNNWVWDTMQAAHVLDNRGHTTSLKFRSFVRLGVGAYDERIAPFMKAKAPGQANRVRDVDLHELLTYGGMDALYTFRLYEKQREEVG